MIKYSSFASTNLNNKNFSNKTRTSLENTFISNFNNVSNARSYGISEFKSSNSLQNSTNAYSMPKDERFKGSYKKLIDTMYNVPDNRNLRATCLGYGQKDITPKGTQTPAPSTYYIKSIFEENLKMKKGTVIGSKLPYKVYN